MTAARHSSAWMATRGGRACPTSTRPGCMRSRRTSRAYGPATPDHVQYWLGNCLGAGRKRIQAWIARFGNRLTAVEIGGLSALVLRDDIEELAATTATTAVRLLPRYDQWVLGPGTADTQIVPPRRADAGQPSGQHRDRRGSRVRDVVARRRPGRHRLVRRRPAGPRGCVAAEVARLATIVDRPLQAFVRTA